MESDVDADEDRLLARLPEDGSPRGNNALITELGWDEDRYYRVRNSLEDRGRLRRWKGRGGTVRRVTAATSIPVVTIPAEADTPQEVEQAIRRELDLYEPMQAVIAGDWAKDHRSDPLAVEITAQQGRRPTGGTWTRPDIVSVEVRTFPFVPGKFLEVVTFEVKPSTSINVQAVYEALAHRRAATRSYVIAHVPPAAQTELEGVLLEVAAEARRIGIGLVVAEDPENYETWDEQEEAQRHEPDPERLDAFIATQLSEEAKTAISRRLR